MNNPSHTPNSQQNSLAWLCQLPSITKTRIYSQALLYLVPGCSLFQNCITNTLFHPFHYVFQSPSYNPDSFFKNHPQTGIHIFPKSKILEVCTKKKSIQKFNIFSSQFRGIIYNIHFSHNTDSNLNLFSLTYTTQKYYLFFNSPQLVKCFRFRIITKASSYHLHIKQGFCQK